MTPMDFILFGLAIVGGLFALAILFTGILKNASAEIKGGFLGAVTTNFCLVFLRILTVFYFEVPHDMMLWAAFGGAMTGMIWGAIIGIIYGLIMNVKFKAHRKLNKSNIFSKFILVIFFTFYWTIGFSAFGATIALWAEVSRQSSLSCLLASLGFIWLVISPLIGAKFGQRFHTFRHLTTWRAQ